MELSERVARVQEYHEKLTKYRHNRTEAGRRYLNQNRHIIEREVLEAGCLRTFTISPPPAIAGVVLRNVNPFDFLDNAPYGMDITQSLLDILDQTIGVMKDPAYLESLTKKSAPALTSDPIQKGFVFVAMPMAVGSGDLDDVYDTIKTAAQNCGLNAERIDEVETNECITNRILESIRRAEYVIVDLTDSKPNVFYEAGYAQGLGKTPVYIAKKGTNLEFDLQDFPVIFFDSMRVLRNRLESRLYSLSGEASLEDN